MTYCFPSKMYITVLLLTPLILLEINEKVTNGYSIILLIHYNLVTIYCFKYKFHISTTSTPNETEIS